MSSFQTFIATIVGASEIGAGNLQARGLAAVILVAGLLFLFCRERL